MTQLEFRDQLSKCLQGQADTAAFMAVIDEIPNALDPETTCDQLLNFIIQLLWSAILKSSAGIYPHGELLVEMLGGLHKRRHEFSETIRYDLEQMVDATNFVYPVFYS